MCAWLGLVGVHEDANHSPLRARRRADFGLSRQWKGELIEERVGTVFYMAPEVVQFAYGFPADLWSAGVVSKIPQPPPHSPSCRLTANSVA
jgi:serine/threonine protein kinase